MDISPTFITSSFSNAMHKQINEQTQKHNLLAKMVRLHIRTYGILNIVL